MNLKTASLNRKLSLIKILAENSPINIDKLQKIVGYSSRRKLKKELGELFMVGSYPYTPADYIEIEINNDLVSIILPIAIDKVINLAPEEWISLYNILEKEFEKDPLNPELLEIKNKINTILSFEEFEDNPNILKELRKAIKERKRIIISYWGRNGIEDRRFLDPILVFNHQKQYLLSYCHIKKEIRNFRLDSISIVEITDEPVLFSSENVNTKECIQNFIDFINNSLKKSEEAEILFSESVSYHLDKRLELRILSKNKEYKNKMYIHAKAKIAEPKWFLDVIKGYGKEIIILKPEELRNQVAKSIFTTSIPKVYIPENHKNTNKTP